MLRQYHHHRLVQALSRRLNRSCASTFQSQLQRRRTHDFTSAPLPARPHQRLPPKRRYSSFMGSTVRDLRQGIACQLARSQAGSSHLSQAHNNSPPRQRFLCMNLRVYLLFQAFQHLQLQQICHGRLISHQIIAISHNSRLRVQPAPPWPTQCCLRIPLRHHCLWTGFVTTRLPPPHSIQQRLTQIKQPLL